MRKAVSLTAEGTLVGLSCGLTFILALGFVEPILSQNCVANSFRASAVRAPRRERLFFPTKLFSHPFPASPGHRLRCFRA